MEGADAIYVRWAETYSLAQGGRSGKKPGSSKKRRRTAVSSEDDEDPACRYDAILSFSLLGRKGEPSAPSS
eukprot:6180117-Pyramimonas_sp.AAC.2